MATDPRTIIDSSQDPGLSPTPNNSASSNVADYDTRERKTVIIDYTDPPLYGVPELQIFNDPGGSNGQVQFNKGNRFGGDNNLVWNSKVRTLSILGNLRVSGEITGRIVTNTTKLKITGGEAGDTLITDGTGNLSWVPAGEAVYGNANVANYLPTYTGNLNGSNLTISNTAYIYNISSTGLASLTTANVSGNLTTNAIYTNNYFYANGAPFSGGGGNANTGNFSFIGNTMSVPDDGTIRAYRDAGYQPNVTIELDSAELFPILYSFTSQGLVFPDETTQNTAYPGYQAPVTVSDNAPNSAIEGNIWFNSQAGRSYVKYNDQWVDMNPTTLSPDPANPFDQDLNTTDNVTFNKVSTTNINSNSNIFLSANNNEWKFGDDGSLTFPSNITIGYEGIQASANTVLGILTQGSNGAASLQWTDDFEDPTSVSAVVVNSPFANTGAVQIVTGNYNLISPNNLEHSWTFDANGNLTFPDSTVQTTAYTGQQNSEILISNVAPNANVEGRLWFNSVDGRTYVTYNSQWVDSSPAVMDASALRTDQDDNLELPGSAIFLDGRVYQDAANGTTSQRWVNMLPGEGENREMLRAYRDGFSNGDEVDERGQLGLVYQSPTISGLYITSFDGNNENKWTFEGTGNIRFPDDTIQTTAYQPATLLDGGLANAVYESNIPPGGIPNPFNQELNTTDTVQFSNINASYFIGNGSMLTGISGGNANTGDVTFINNTIIGDGNLNLQPNNSVSSAYLDIYLTTGPDIHIASNSENLILGRDSGPNVLVGVNGNVSIRANSGTGYTWTFDSTGNLTLPNNTFAINYANGTQVSLGGGSYGDSNVVTLLGSFGSNSISTTGNARVGQLSATATDSYDSIQFSSNGIADNGGIKVDSGSNMVVKAVSNFYVKRAGSDRLAITDTTSQVMASTNVEIQSNKAGTTNTWTFDSTGNLTLPGNNATIGAVGEFRIWATNTDITVYRNGQDGYGVKSGKVEVFANNAKITETTSSGFEVLLGNVTGNYFIGNGSQLTGLPAPVVTQDITSNGAMSIMAYDGNIKYISYATVEPSTGNITGNYFIGNGSALTSIAGGNVSGTVANATYATSAGSATTAGTVTTNAQPNITSVGTLANLTVSGTSVTGVSSILAGPTFTPLANTTAGFVSNVNSYTQLTIQNKSTGADATTDFVATADNGSDTVNYLDVGIINSGYDNGTPTNSLGNIVYAADSYMYAQGNASATGQSGGNLAIGTTVASKTVKIFAGGVTSSNIVASFANTGANITGNLNVSGNITGANISGNISITGNVQGTSSNVSLVAGSYTMTFDNTGILTLPRMGGDEGGEINLGIPASNTTLSTRVVLDVYQDRLRFFDGSTKGAYIDLSQATSGVGTLLNNRVSGLVNAGTFVTMDLIKATVTTSGQRGLSLATTTGTFACNIGGTYATTTPSTGGSAGTLTITTTASSSIFNWSFPNQGDISTYILTDTTNSRAYRITLQIGSSYNNNMISIERLI